MKQITLLFFYCLTLLSSNAQDLLITEIMYNPDNSDSSWEWVEVYNAGQEPIDLAGFVIDDNSGALYSEANIPSGTILSGESAILFNASALTTNEFLEVWGIVDIIPVTRWSALNNGGDSIGIWSSFESYSGDNLTQENVIEQVIYEANGDWPVDDGAASIYLTNLAADNSDGTNWALSVVGVQTPLFEVYSSSVSEENDGQDIASPGLSSSADTEKPIVICPEDIEMASDNDNCGSTFPFLIPTGTDNSTENLTFLGERSDGLELTDIYPIGPTSITWTAVDEAGNISEPCIQLIVITDDIAPSIECGDTIEVLSSDGNPINITIEAPTAFNVCEGNVEVSGMRSDEKDLEEPFAIGTTTIMWKATDDSGNMAECEQLVTVNQSASMANEITFFSIPNQSEDVLIDAENKMISIKVPFGTELDALIPIIEISEEATISPETGVAQNFTSTVAYTVTAQDGSEQVWMVVVEVDVDITNPLIECPSDIIVQSDEGECGALVEFEISFSDEDTATVLETSIESGSLFPVGITEIVATATDSSGNSATCEFTITVEDKSPPILICKDMNAQLNTDGNAQILITDLYDTLVDNCGIESVTASQLAFSESDLGENEVTVTAIDIHGNTSSCIALVNVINEDIPELAITEFVLVNADNNEDILILDEGMSINVKNLPTQNLNIRTNTSGEVESVFISINGDYVGSRIENVAPYALFGDSPAGNYNGYEFVTGSYQLMATPYSQDNLAGEMGEVLSVNFELFEENQVSVTHFMLVNADTNEDLFLLTEGMEIDVNSLPSRNLDFRAITGEGVESVQLRLEGNMQAIRTENVAPYALYGDYPMGDYNGMEFTEGLYEIIAIPFSEDGLSGEMGDSLSVSFEIVDLAPMVAITSFTLVNADTNDDIMDLTEGLEIDLTQLPTQNLDIRANTSANVKSVSLSLSGTKNSNRTENVAPFALFGDFPIGVYNGSNFGEGTYEMSAVGYSEIELGGEVSESFSVQFEIVNNLVTAESLNPMSVYPNPASDKVVLQFETPKGLTIIQLYDVLGRVVGSYKGKQVSQGDNHVLRLESIPEGNYYIKSIDENGRSYMKQILVKK